MAAEEDRIDWSAAGIDDSRPVESADTQEAPRVASDVALRSISPKSLANEGTERYELAGTLGAGGMGSVYRARDRQLGRTIALKVMHRRIARKPDLVRRFIMEAQVTAQLEHPGIVPTYSLTAGEDGAPQLAMRMIPGQTLQGLIDDAARDAFREKNNLLGLRERLQLFVTACGAVHFAHERGVLHRDLKPDNIMVGRHGDAYVMDWGLAKLRTGEIGGPTAETDAGEETEAVHVDSSPRATRMGEMMGTLAYMPPEQATGDLDRMGPAADQFAMGLTLQELVTLRPARDWQYHGKTIEQATGGLREPMPDWVPPGLRAIVARATALRPEDRYADMLALGADVRRFIHDEPLEVMPDDLLRRIWRTLDGHRTLVLGVLLLLVVAVGSLSLMQVRASLSQARARAAQEHRMAALFTSVSGQAQALDRRARGLEMQLAMLAGAVGEALSAPPKPDFEPLRPADLRGPRAPADTRMSARFAQRVSFLSPVYVRAPDAEPTAAAADEARLARLQAELIEAFAGAGKLTGTATEGARTPAHWVYAATPAGVMVNYPGADGIRADYDPRKRPWYPATAGTHGPHWGAVYGDAAGSGTLVPCNRAVYDADGKLRAIVGIDFYLQDLRGLIPLPDVAGYRDAWLLDPGGRIVVQAHQDVEADHDASDDGVRRLPMFPVARLLEAVIEAPASGQHVVGDVRYVYARVPALGWTYVAAFDSMHPR